MNNDDAIILNQKFRMFHLLLFSSVIWLEQVYVIQICVHV